MESFDSNEQLTGRNYKNSDNKEENKYLKPKITFSKFSGANSPASGGGSPFNF